MKRFIWIIVVIVAFCVIGKICFHQVSDNVFTQFNSEYDMSCRRGGGRGFVELIRHLSHLNIIGWIYLVASICFSVISSFFIEKLIPLILGKMAKITYPDFTLLITPKNNKSISVLIFMMLFSCVGFWGESSDDVSFFVFMGGVFTLIYFCTFLCTTFRNHVFMIRNGNTFISKFALLGLYNRIDLQQSVKDEKYTKEGTHNYWQLIDQNSNKYRIYKSSYSEKGQQFIDSILSQVSNS